MKALGEIYKIYTFLHLWNPIEKPWEALRASVLRTKHTAPEKNLSDFCTLGLLHLGTSAPWDSNLKTKQNASGKRPPDEAHGPGDETIRPHRSSEAERSSEKKDSKIQITTVAELKNSATIRQLFSQFADLLSTCSLFFKLVSVVQHWPIFMKLLSRNSEI